MKPKSPNLIDFNDFKIVQYQFCCKHDANYIPTRNWLGYLRCYVVHKNAKNVVEEYSFVLLWNKYYPQSLIIKPLF